MSWCGDAMPRGLVAIQGRLFDDGGVDMIVFLVVRGDSPFCEVRSGAGLLSSSSLLLDHKVSKRLLKNKMIFFHLK